MVAVGLPAKNKISHQIIKSIFVLYRRFTEDEDLKHKTVTLQSIVLY